MSVAMSSLPCCTRPSSLSDCSADRVTAASHDCLPRSSNSLETSFFLLAGDREGELAAHCPESELPAIEAKRTFIRELQESCLHAPAALCPLLRP